MSAPDTNTARQARRHRPALIGIAVAIVLAALFFLTNLFNAADTDGSPRVTAPETTPQATPEHAPEASAPEPETTAPATPE